MELKVKYNKVDILKSYYITMFDEPKNIIITIFSVVLIPVIIFFYSGNSNFLIMLLLLLISPILFLIIIPYRYYLKIKSLKDFQVENIWNIVDDSITTKNEFSESTRLISYYDRYINTKNYIVFVKKMNLNVYIILPKRFFPSKDDLKNFEELLRKYLSKKKR